MVVKNESRIIKEALESAKSIIDYWVIVDTGSTDNTKEIIKETLKDIPGELIERPWINFGHNRTEVANYTKNKADYTLMLDADEILDIKPGEFDKKCLIADSYMVKIDDGTNYYYYSVLLSNFYQWKSVGVTHEYWNMEGREIRETLSTIKIIHKCCGDYRKEKFEKDRDLLLEGISKELTNTRYYFYLAQTYMCLGDLEKAIEWSQKRIELGGWGEEIHYSLFTIVRCKIMLEKPFEEILEDMYRAYFYHPKSAESIYEVLKYCRIKKYYNIGYYLGRLAMQINKPKDDVLFVRKAIYQYQILDELSMCAYYIGKYKEAYELGSKIIVEDLYPVWERERLLNNYEFFKAKGAKNE
jgi:glycosyltransferase involved in cell wall biosynthesis